MNTVKKFKEKIDLKSHEITEKSLKIIEKAIKLHENLANDENEDDVDYLIDRFNYLENLFKSLIVK